MLLEKQQLTWNEETFVSFCLPGVNNKVTAQILLTKLGVAVLPATFIPSYFTLLSELLLFGGFGFSPDLLLWGK